MSPRTNMTRGARKKTALRIAVALLVPLCYAGAAAGALPDECECVDQDRKSVGCGAATAVQCLLETSYCGSECDLHAISLNDWYSDINEALAGAGNTEYLGFDSPVVVEANGGKGGTGTSCTGGGKGSRGYMRTTRTLADLTSAMGSGLLYAYIGRAGEDGKLKYDSTGGKGGASSLIIGEAVEDIERPRDPGYEGVVGIAGGGGGRGSCVGAISGGNGGDGACAISYTEAQPEDCDPENGRDAVVQGADASATGGYGKLGSGGGNGAQGGNRPGPGDVRDGQGGLGRGDGKDGNDGIGGVGGTWKKSKEGYTSWYDADNKRSYAFGRGGNGANARGGGGGGGFGGGGGGQSEDTAKTKGSGGGGGGAWTVTATQEEANVPFFGKSALSEVRSTDGGVAALTFQLVGDDATTGVTLDIEHDWVLSARSRVDPRGRLKLVGTYPASSVDLRDDSEILVEMLLEDDAGAERVAGLSSPLTLRLAKGGEKPLFEGRARRMRVRLQFHPDKRKLELHMQGAVVQRPAACTRGEDSARLRTQILIGPGPFRDLLVADTEWTCARRGLRVVDTE